LEVIDIPGRCGALSGFTIHLFFWTSARYDLRKPAYGNEAKWKAS